jgi:hypothetical protein
MRHRQRPDSVATNSSYTIEKPELDGRGQKPEMDGRGGPSNFAGEMGVGQAFGRSELPGVQELQYAYELHDGRQD